MVEGIKHGVLSLQASLSKSPPFLSMNVQVDKAASCRANENNWLLLIELTNHIQLLGEKPLPPPMASSRRQKQLTMLTKRLNMIG